MTITPIYAALLGFIFIFLSLRTFGCAANIKSALAMAATPNCKGKIGFMAILPKTRHRVDFDRDGGITGDSGRCSPSLGTHVIAGTNSSCLWRWPKQRKAYFSPDRHGLDAYGHWCGRPYFAL